jgi:hypothetical protein
MQGINYRLDIKKGLLVSSNDETIVSTQHSALSTQHSALVFHLYSLSLNLISLSLECAMCAFPPYFQLLSMVARGI